MASVLLHGFLGCPLAVPLSFFHVSIGSICSMSGRRLVFCMILMHCIGWKRDCMCVLSRKCRDEQIGSSRRRIRKTPRLHIVSFSSFLDSVIGDCC